MEGSIGRQSRFFRVADEIRAEGRQPSQRAIRERLAKGGSFSELGPLYVEWAMARDYYPRPTKENLPEPFLNKHDALAAEKMERRTAQRICGSPIESEGGRRGTRCA